MSKITLMITGASGFIGSNFIEKYRKDYNIISVDLLKKKPEDLSFDGVDCILHLAAVVHQMKGAAREKYFEVNTELTRRMAENAKIKGVKHFVFYSTVKVYGYDGDLKNHNYVLNELSECNPKDDPYGESKWEAEKILKELESENFRVAIIRPPMVYGKGVKGNMENLIKLIKKSPILPFKYDKNKRSLVNINNLLYLTYLVINQQAQGVFLPLDEKNLSLKEIFEGIEEAIGIRRVNIRLFKPLFWILTKLKPKIMLRLYGSLQFNNEKTKSEINYQPIISYKNGIKEAI